MRKPTLHLFIAAAFAICPIIIAVQVGRFIDTGRDAQTNWLGGTIFTLARASFAVWGSPAGLLIGSMVMGIGHIINRPTLLHFNERSSIVTRCDNTMYYPWNIRRCYAGFAATGLITSCSKPPATKKSP